MIDLLRKVDKFISVLCTEVTWLVLLSFYFDVMNI